MDDNNKCSYCSKTMGNGNTYYVFSYTQMCTECFVSKKAKISCNECKKEHSICLTISNSPVRFDCTLCNKLYTSIQNIFLTIKPPYTYKNIKDIYEDDTIIYVYQFLYFSQIE